MGKLSVLSFIKQLERPIFTTNELAACSGRSLSCVTQALNYLERQGVIFKVYRGIWVEKGNESLSPYKIIPFLFPRHRAYVSFVSALHMYDMVEQIPQVITVASTSHTKTICTKLGVFSVHKIAPSFFKGFDWYKKTGSFLIAEPEKALVDCLYLSARRKKQFSHFPELYFPKLFSFKKAKEWAKKISNHNIRVHVQKKLSELQLTEKRKA